MCSQLKILAINLPQFHTFPENDKWWGKGFTEWVNVKRAQPLFNGHMQPLVPLAENYYDLSEKRTIIWQHDLAKQYGVDGFLYYHYWFDGKLLLEKPLEVLLDTPEASREFCLCWANEPWTRAWDGKNSEILMPQKYGGVEDWEKHINYLLPFFRDNRYIRQGGRPVLFVYTPNNIPCFDEMIAFWNKRLAEEKIEPLYLIEYLSTFNPRPFSSVSSAVMEFEPLYSANFQISNPKRLKRLINKKLKLTDILDYDYLWRCLLDRHNRYPGKEVVRSCFTNFDNSPRKQKRAFLTLGATPEKFQRYFELLLSSHRENENNLVVINAWNEWGEGAILEPTENDGFRWLEAIKETRKFLEL